MDIQLRNKAVESLTRTIERFEYDTEAPDFCVIVPSAQIDFAYLLNIISLDDYYNLHKQLDGAKERRVKNLTQF